MNNQRDVSLNTLSTEEAIEFQKAGKEDAVPPPPEVTRLWEQIATLQKDLDELKAELRRAEGDGK